MAEALSPFAYLKRAARGDLDAQRALADAAVQMVSECEDSDPTTALTEGLVFARMAAEHGDVSDRGRVISMLSLLSDLLGEDGDDEMAEAIARTFMAADEGYGGDRISDSLPGLVESASPEVMATARWYQDRLKED